MIRLKKYGVLAALCFTVVTLGACGKRTEAVITDGEDITDTSVEYPTLEESHEDIFTYNDLKVGNVTYLMTEAQVKSILGKPTEETENNNEKIYSYNELSIGFEKLDDDNREDANGTYKVTRAASIKTNDIFSRNMKVGDSVDDIIKSYYRDQNYQNHLYVSEDKTLTYGKFLYGEFTTNELEKINTKDPIAYGLINYNGYNSIEIAESYNVEFTYFDGKYKGSQATIDDDFATLNFEIDNNGKITGISWFYYPEQK